MQLASIRLKLALGSDVPKNDVTPAELLLLREGHKANAGGDPIRDFRLTGETSRTDAEEFARLQREYNNMRDSESKSTVFLLGKLFPGAAPKLPQTFKEVGLSIQGTDAAPAASQVDIRASVAPPAVEGIAESSSTTAPDTVAEPSPAAKKPVIRR